MLTSVAIKHSLEHIGLTDIYFKWPNDIYCQNKKISGVIQEAFLNKSNQQILIIGVGINYLSSPVEKRYNTTHIAEYVENISLEKYFEIYINYFLHYFDNFYSKNNIFFVQEYKKFQMFLNTNIKVKLNESEIIKGKFMGIKDDGSLIFIKEKKESLIYSGQILI